MYLKKKSLDVFLLYFKFFVLLKKQTKNYKKVTLKIQFYVSLNSENDSN